MKKLVITLIALIALLLVALLGVYRLLAAKDPVREVQIERLTSISPDARELLKQPDAPTPDLPVSVMRELTDKFQADFSSKQRLRYPVAISESNIAGVPVRLITPKAGTKSKQILLNLHGGGFFLDAGSLSENIPLAVMTQRTVIAVLYRLSPENAFPAARDDMIAVYKELLKTHAASDIVLYGTSAGAILTAEAAVRMKQLGLPLPAALGIFSGVGTFDFNTDTMSGGNPLVPMAPASQLQMILDDYVANTDVKDPMLSPLYADLGGLPPTLLITGTRDMFLSGTSIFHRALLAANVDARLVVFEAMPHAHWMHMDIPESTETFEIMAKFFKQQLEH